MTDTRKDVPDDKTEDERPTLAKDLKTLARTVLEHKCKKYLEEDYTGLSPVLLQKQNHEDLLKWGKSNHYREYDETKMIGTEKDYTSKIVTWLNRDYKHSIRVGRAQILIDYLGSLADDVSKEKKKIESEVVASSNFEEICNLMKQYDKAVKAHSSAENHHDAMKKFPDGAGNYTFHPPENADVCKRNLFLERPFTNRVEKRNDNQIRVMHWNILADGLAGSGLSLDQYSKTLEKQFASPKECLVWDYRKWLILEEIAHYEPDIITLVELDGHQDYYEKDQARTTKEKDTYRKGDNFKEASKSLQYYLEKLDYDMEYKAKHARFAEMGTGFFWKKEKLTPMKFKRGAAKRKDGASFPRSDKLMWEVFSEGGQIFSLMRFNTTKGNHKLAVCTVHLQSDKRQTGEDERAHQIWEAVYLLNYKNYTDELKQTLKSMGTKEKTPLFEDMLDMLPDGENITSDYAVIITGDFNAERKFSLSEERKLVRPLAVSVPYTAGFKSFYDEVNGGDLPWTSWKKRPAGRTDRYAIDYVFGSKEKTKGLAVLGSVPDDKVDARILLPNYESGSDHISLVVDFEIVDPTKKGWGLLVWGIVVALVIVVISMIYWMFAGQKTKRRGESTSTSVD